MTVDVESLGRPKHQNGKEVGTRDEGDDQGEGEDTGFLAETLGEHGEFGKLGFPDAEGDE